MSPAQATTRLDPHSCFSPAQARTAHWRLRLRADFERKVLAGEVELVFESPAGGRLDLDTKGLKILGASSGGASVPFELAPEQPILGRRLRLSLPAGARSVTISYETSPDAAGLQWLSPEQTAGKRRPFLFSQCQAIHARSVVPCQDSPAARVTYEAELDVPGALTAVMSAGPEGAAAGAPGRRVFRFRMPQPIPPYLFALAVGELESRELSPRSRVWAEPATVEAAAWEFAGVEDMLRAAERLFGPYDWERYDMLVLPPSFPYGGMENPRMTFLTPTLLAGDRSLVDVVAHELAHSWTGNLVTNATAEHFWLNEGFTVWAERRILRALRGDEAAGLAWAIGQKALEDELERFKDKPQLTRLRTHLTGVDPDDAFSSIPYEKGARFLTSLERGAGEAAWDAFVQRYMARYRFKSVTTEQFCALVEDAFPALLAKIDALAWLDGPGLPADAPRFVSTRLETLAALAAGFAAGRRPDAKTLGGLPADELLVFLQKLPRALSRADCAWLDENLKLSERGNHEILAAWLWLAAANGYTPAFPRLRRLLSEVGRMKYVRPLYQALGKTPDGRKLAREVFAAASPSYHALTRRAARAALDAYPAD